MNGLTVIIPSRNINNLIPCLYALFANEPFRNVIIVNDGLGLGPIPAGVNFGVWWLRNPTQIAIVEGEKPFIFSRNCNLGISAAGVDDVLLLNDDALLGSYPGFSRMQSELSQRPDFGLVSASTNNVGNPNQFRISDSGWREEKRMVCFVAVLIPRSTIDKVGLLDERYCVDYGLDDDDYCLRVRRAGMKLGIYDGCFVDHCLPSTFRAPGGPGSKGYQGNLKVFREKWGPAAAEYDPSKGSANVEF